MYVTWFVSIAWVSLPREDVGLDIAFGNVFFVVDYKDAIAVPTTRKKVALRFRYYSMWRHVSIFLEVSFPLFTCMLPGSFPSLVFHIRVRI